MRCALPGGISQVHEDYVSLPYILFNKLYIYESFSTVRQRYKYQVFQVLGA